MKLEISIEPIIPKSTPIYESIPIFPQSHNLDTMKHLLQTPNPLSHHATPMNNLTLLPHLHSVNNHLPIILPCGIPLILRIPEVLLRSRARIHPRLAIRTIQEPPILSSHSHIDNEIEFLVKRRVYPSRLTPWIHQEGSVNVREWEAPLRPQ